MYVEKPFSCFQYKSSHAFCITVSLLTSCSRFMPGYPWYVTVTPLHSMLILSTFLSFKIDIPLMSVTSWKTITSCWRRKTVFEQWKTGPNLADLKVWRMSYSHTGKWNNGFQLLRNLGVPNGSTDQSQSTRVDLGGISGREFNGIETPGHQHQRKRLSDVLWLCLPT